MDKVVHFKCSECGGNVFVTMLADKNGTILFIGICGKCKTKCTIDLEEALGCLYGDQGGGNGRPK